MKASNATFLDDNTGGKGKYFRARILQAGLVKYSFGVCLLEKDTIDKFIYNFVGCPVIIDHKDVTNENAKEERVGVISRVWFEQMDGWYWVEGIIFDEKAISLINDGYNVSCQYEISEYANNVGKKLHNGNPFDKVILNGKPEHLAIVKNPRYENALIAINALDLTAENARGFDGSEGKWVTIKGTHVFIPDGKTVEEVMQEKGWLSEDKKEKKETSKYHDYLKSKINDSWYKNSKIDYDIDGKLLDTTLKDDTLSIIWEEKKPNSEKKKFKMDIPYASDYTNEQLYNIWSDQSYEPEEITEKQENPKQKEDKYRHEGNIKIKQITREEWKNTPNDYKMTKDGKKYIMYLDKESGATVLGRAEIVDDKKETSDSTLLEDGIKESKDKYGRTTFSKNNKWSNVMSNGGRTDSWIASYGLSHQSGVSWEREKGVMEEQLLDSRHFTTEKGAKRWALAQLKRMTSDNSLTSTNSIIQAINEIKETDMFKNLFKKKENKMNKDELKSLFMECLSELTAKNEADEDDKLADEKIADNEEDDKKEEKKDEEKADNKCKNEVVDKRDIIRQIMAIAGKEEASEDVKEIAKLAEKLAYDKSEADKKADNKCKNEDDEDDDKKVENEEKEDEKEKASNSLDDIIGKMSAGTFERKSEGYMTQKKAVELGDKLF